MTLLTPDGWINHPDFLRVDGVPDKMYTDPNTGLGGIACHSVVGEEADHLDGVPNRFLSLERLPNGQYTPYAAASCMFILRKRMPHVQMYPVWAATWTSGSRGANTTTWAIEAEGGFNPHNEPLTHHQEIGFLIIATAWEERMNRSLVVGQTVRPHWQLALDYGAAPTACESGRYRNAWARLNAGERIGAGMASQEYRELLARIEDAELAMAAGAEERGADGEPLPRGDRLWKARFRIADVASGNQQSYGDRASSAVVLSKTALAAVGALSAAAGAFGAAAGGLIP